ncbi:MAG: DUF6247 family protein [Candidatus Limnocylindria bacterium]
MIQRIAYQATDLARNHRKVLAEARAGYAVVRDKDGTTLILTPAAEVEKLRELSELALGLATLQRVLARPVDQRPTALFGSLAWASALPEDSQREFAEELADALLVAGSGASMEPVRELITDWIATAEAWADPETRERLLADEPKPLGTALDA